VVGAPLTTGYGFSGKRLRTPDYGKEERHPRIRILL